MADWGVARERPVLTRTPEGLGVHDTALRLDPVRAASLAFLSSGLGAPALARRHQRVVTTALTQALLGLPEGKGALPVPLDRPFELGRLTLELRPSGRLPGAAQLRALTPAGVELCYAGVWRPDGSPTAAAGSMVPCDLLVFQAEVWPGPGRAPRRADVLATLLARLAEAARGDGAVVRGHPLRALPDLLAALGAADLPSQATPPVRRVARALAMAGLPVGLPSRLGSAPAPDTVVLLPPGAPVPAALASRTVLDLVLPGEARTPGALTWCDLPDLGDLVAYAEEAAAEQVLVTGAGARSLAQALAAKGVPALPHDPTEQLALL